MIIDVILSNAKDLCIANPWILPGLKASQDDSREIWGENRWSGS